MAFLSEEWEFYLGFGSKKEIKGNTLDDDEIAFVLSSVVIFAVHLYFKYCLYILVNINTNIEEKY